MRIEFISPKDEITDEMLARVLGLVGADTACQMARLTKYERILAYDWAMREHLTASDNLCRRRPKPSFIEVT
jgi:hypothetical protein